jgi:DNA polymerase-3 subunit alpha
MQHSGFVHLHVHSYYSLLDGAAPIGKLAEKASSFRMPALAITDHANLFGAVEFYQTLSKAGVKPVIGSEVYLLTKGSRFVRDLKQEGMLAHLTLLVKNRTGYKNLCRLLSSAHLEGFYYKPRIDMEILREHHEGLIALSGCLSGEISKHLLEDRWDEAKEAAANYSQIFDDNRFFLEVQDQGLPGQDKVRSGVVELGRELGLPLVATNDVHYLERSSAEAQDALLCIQTAKAVSDEKRMRMGKDEFYFKSPEEMTELFKDIPEAIENTVAVAERCNLEFEFNTYHFPKFAPPEGKDLATHLEELAHHGLVEHWPHIMAQRKGDEAELRAEYERRLFDELAMIKKMGFAGYFLIVADFIGYAKKKGLPVGPGRGSAAGSLVAYCLKITDIDPLVHDLLFERFLNPERISMPDMDIDFCMRRRDEVIQYVAEKYGNVSQIITFGKMKARAVVRDVGRVLGMPYGEVDRIAKLIPATLGMTLEQALQIEPRLKEVTTSSELGEKLITISKALEGFPRHASTHAAGVVISDQPLTEFLPLYRGSRDEVVTQFDMKAVEKVGLIKFDFLGLRTLTVIDDTLTILKQREDIDLNIDDIPLDDQLIYSKLSEGDTAGIFQLESSGMTDLVMKLKPSAFSDIVALVALFRPGPLGSGMVDDFIARKHGKKSIRYDLPQLEPILRDTYGVIVYQEQVMRIASALANFSLGDADILRRAMGKKKMEEMAKQKEKFLAGTRENKIPSGKAERIFDLMAKFAEYGFNRSHSAAYAMVAYQTAYLKYHHRTEFMAALLTSEKDNTDKILQYIGDCKAKGINILPPDVNESDRDFSVVGKEDIRFGLAAVKNVGEAAIDNALEARENDGPFTSFLDFCERVDGRKANRRVLESLIKCGAFDFTKAWRAQLVASLDKTMEIAAGRQRDLMTGQSRIFDLMGDAGETAAADVKLPDVPEWPERERLSNEKEALGFYITGHPLAQLEDLLNEYATCDTSNLIQVPDKQEVRIGGVVAKLREITTKRGDRMGFVTLEDLKGSSEVVVFSDVYQESLALIKGERPIFVVGSADTDGETAKIIARSIVALSDVPEQFTESIHFHLHSPEIDENHLQQLKNVISRYPGQCPAYVHLFDQNNTETVLRLPDDMRLSPNGALVKAVEKLFGHNVTQFRPKST